MWLLTDTWMLFNSRILFRVVVLNLWRIYLIFHSVTDEMASQWAFTRVIESTQNDLHKIHIQVVVDVEPPLAGATNSDVKLVQLRSYLLLAYSLKPHFLGFSQYHG